MVLIWVRFWRKRASRADISLNLKQITLDFFVYADQSLLPVESVNQTPGQNKKEEKEKALTTTLSSFPSFHYVKFLPFYND